MSKKINNIIDNYGNGNTLKTVGFNIFQKNSVGRKEIKR